jgi:two-component system OmpR family response regulator
MSLFDPESETASPDPGVTSWARIRRTNEFAPSTTLSKARLMTALSGISILVVDDNDDNLELMEMCLNLAGAAVRTAQSASAAYEVASDFRPQVLISDISLPDEDGCSMLETLRSKFDLGEMRAIAVTGHSEPATREAAAKAGFQGYVVKPVTIPVLTEVVLGLLAAPSGAAAV